MAYLYRFGGTDGDPFFSTNGVQRNLMKRLDLGPSAWDVEGCTDLRRRAVRCIERMFELAPRD